MSKADDQAKAKAEQKTELSQNRKNYDGRRKASKAKSASK